MCLTIVIPIFNEEKFIANTINRIVHLLNPSVPYEIIAVNNASTDSSLAILKTFDDIKIVNLEKKVTVSAARNIGFQSAAFPIVAFIDGDMLLTPSWIEAFIAVREELLTQPLQITGCKVALSENPSWLEQSWFGNMNTTKVGQNYINSGNLITTAIVMKTIGGFDENLITGEDVDFCKRATEAGITLNINTRFVAHHEGYPKDISSFLKRERWHGVGDVKSFTTFIHSKVAVFSFAIIGLSLLTIIFGLLNINSGMAACLLAVVLLNSYAIYSRFAISNVKLAGRLFCIQYLYALGRVLSIFDRTRI